MSSWSCKNERCRGIGLQTALVAMGSLGLVTAVLSQERSDDAPVTGQAPAQAGSPQAELGGGPGGDPGPSGLPERMSIGGTVVETRLVPLDEGWRAVAVAGEGSRGSRFTAFVSDGRAMRTLWTFPTSAQLRFGRQSEDGVSVPLGQTWFDTGVYPLPLGPIVWDEDGDPYTTADRRPRHVALLNGGYDPAQRYGRGLYLVDARTGELLWKWEHDPDARDGREELRYSFGAAPALYQDPRCATLGPTGEPVFNALTAVDSGGQVWMASLCEPPQHSGGLVRNWEAHRVLRQDGIAPGAGFHIAAISREGRGTIAAFGSGDMPRRAVALASCARADDCAAGYGCACPAGFDCGRGEGWCMAPSLPEPCSAEHRLVKLELPAPDDALPRELATSDLVDVTGDDGVTRGGASAYDAGWLLRLPRGEGIVAAAEVAAPFVFPTHRVACGDEPARGRLVVLNRITGGAAVDLDGDGLTQDGAADTVIELGRRVPGLDDLRRAAERLRPGGAGV